MQLAEFGKFAEVWTQCWDFYGKSVTEGTLRLAFEALKRYELKDITIGLTRHMNDPDAGQFFPKPADVVRNIDGSKSSRAMLAWSKVDKAIRSVGHYRSVVFDDPIIHCVIADMGGWIGLNSITEEEMPFRAREFEKRYQGYVMRPISEYPRKMIGVAEAHNSSKGHKVEPPVLIGDSNLAESVYRLGMDEPKPFAVTLGSLANKAVAHLTDNRTKERA